MGKDFKIKMENNVNIMNVPLLEDSVSKVKVSRKFVGDESLGEILASVFENQVDNMFYKYYHTERAETVTSHTTQSEGNELL